MPHVQTAASSAGTTEVVPAKTRMSLVILSCPTDTADTPSPEVVRFTLDGTAASATNGITLAPGAAIVLDGGRVPKQGVKAWSAGSAGKIDAYYEEAIANSGMLA